jgi:glycosyltransferase involved in cell wall biosynthesis
MKLSVNRRPTRLISDYVRILKLSGRPTISLVIPVYNGGLNFRRCLESVVAAVPPADEVIVVADGDTDGSWIFASKLGARVFRLPTRSGLARARNCGAREAKGEILFFVDPEVTIPTNAFAQVADRFVQDPGAAAVVGSYDDAPAADDFFSQYKSLFHHYVQQRVREEAPMFWSVCGAIRRSVFFEIGGFDERYGESTIEGMELSCRLQDAGHKIQLCKLLQVKNLRQWQAKGFITKDFFFHVLPWTELLLRHRHLHEVGLSRSGKASVLLTHGIWGSLIGAGWMSELFIVAGGLFLALLAINWSLYRFFLKKRGWRFANKAILWQGLYYGYCALVFLVGPVFFWWKKREPAPTSLVLTPEGRPDSLRRPEWR